MAIATHQSIHVKEIPVEFSLKNILSNHSINLVGIEDFINTKHSFKLWSLYIPPSSNLSTSLLNNIFQLIGPNSILGGDIIGHHPAWDNNNNINYRGESIYSSFINYNVNCLNSGVQTRVNRPLSLTLP